MPQRQRHTTAPARVLDVLEGLDDVGDTRRADEEAEDQCPEMRTITTLVRTRREPAHTARGTVDRRGRSRERTQRHSSQVLVPLRLHHRLGLHRYMLLLLGVGLLLGRFFVHRRGLLRDHRDALLGLLRVFHCFGLVGENAGRFGFGFG